MIPLLVSLPLLTTVPSMTKSPPIVSVMAGGIINVVPNWMVNIYPKSIRVSPLSVQVAADVSVAISDRLTT